MSIYNIDSIWKAVYPDIRVRLLRVYEDMWIHHGRKMRPSETGRDFLRQAELFDQGRTKPGKIVTWARPGQSAHNFFLAVDSVFVGADPYLEKMIDRDAADQLWKSFATRAQAHGLDAGGLWPKKRDFPHVELLYGMTLTDCLTLYNHGKIPAVWARIDQILGLEQGSSYKNVYGPTVIV